MTDMNQEIIPFQPLPLKPNQTIESYKAMCEILGEPYLSSYSKESQLNAWQGFFEWKMEGRKFKITRIYSPHFVPSASLKKNSKKHYNDAQKIILNMLKNKEFLYQDGAHFVSMSKLIKSVGLCNENYFHFISSKREYAIANDYSIDFVVEFFKRSFRMFKNDTINILKGLESQALLKVRNTYIVTPLEYIETEKTTSIKRLTIELKDKYRSLKPREATEKEMEYIQEAQFKTLQEMGYTSISSLFAVNRYDEYKKKLENRLFKEYELTKVYKAFKINFSTNVMNKIESDGCDLFNLTSKELIEKKKNVSKMSKSNFKSSTTRSSKKKEVKYHEDINKQVESNEKLEHMIGIKRTDTTEEDVSFHLFGRDYERKMSKMSTNLISYKTNSQLRAHLADIERKIQEKEEVE